MVNLTFKQTQETAFGMEMADQQAAEINPQLVSAVQDLRFTECWRCGGKHPPDDCNFKDAECFRCHQTGHIRKRCRSRKTYQVQSSGPRNNGRFKKNLQE